MRASKVVRRFAVLSAAAAAAVVASRQATAADATWNGATSGAWEIGTNWTPNASPGATGTTTNGDTATFNAASANLTVTPDAGRNLKNITFDTAAAGVYVIGTTGGSPLLLTDGGTIQTTSTVAATETINAPLVLQGTGATAYSFNSSATANTNLLNFGGGITAVSGTPTLTLTGTNLVAFPNNTSATSPATNAIAGVIGNGTATSLALAKTGAGSWTLSAANTYTGGTSINAGVLTIRNSTALGTGAVNVAAGGQLQFGPSGLNVANNITLNGITTGGALVGGVDTGAVSNTLSGQLTLAADSNISTYWSDKTLTITGKVTGPGNLRIDKALSGNNAPAIVLSNTANDYAGGTNINGAGTVLAFANGALGPGNLTFTTAGTLRWSTGNTQDVSAKVQAIASGVTATFDTNSNNVTFATGPSGAGAIAKSGAGTLTLPTVSTYAGGTTVNGGTLSTPTIADSGSSGIGAGAVTLVGGTFQYTGAAAVTTARTFAAANTSGGTIDVNNAAGGLEITSGFAGNGASIVTKTGPGTLTLSGTADNGALSLNVQAGTVLLNKSAAGGTRAVAGISNIAPGATVRLVGSANDQIFGGSYASTSPNYGLVNMTGGTLDLNGKSESFDRLTGTGTVTNNAAAGTTSTVTIGESNGAGPFGSTTTFGGAIADGASGGKVALVKTGTGTVVLTGPHTYTGGTTVSNGTLRINPGVPVQGAAVWLDASNTGSVSLNGANVSNWNDLSGNGRNGAQATAASQPGYTTNAAAGGKNVVRFSAAGQALPTNLSFLNGSAYTVFAIEAKAGVVPSSSYYFLGTQTGATNQGLHFGYRNDTDYALAQYSNDLDYTSAPAFTAQTFREWVGRLDTSATGGHSLFLNGTQVASNTNITPLTNPGAGVVGQGFQASTQYLGDLGEIIIFPTALSAAQRAQVDAYLQAKWLGVGTIPNVLPASSPLTLSAAGATLDLNGYSQTIGSLTGVAGSAVTTGTNAAAVLTTGDATNTTFAGVISGAGGLAKAGAGNLTLTGVNTYTGPTTVTAGAIFVGQGGTGSLGTTAVTVSGTGKLGGAGTVGGPVTISSGGTLAPGNSVGTIGTGNLALSSGGTLAIELDPTNSAGNGTTDQVAVTGTVNLTGSTLSLSLLSQPTAGQQFTIINNDGTADAVTGTFANGPSVTVGSFQYTINYAGGDGNDVVLTASPVPEPAAAGLLGLTAVGLLARRRRRA